MIGYYVHHQGAGHLARALAIAAGSEAAFTLLGTGLSGRCGAVACIDLPDDRADGDGGFEGRDGEADRPQGLHYAPLGHDGVRRRTAAVAGWMAERRPDLMVVDVSVEIALLARLASTPVVYVRLSGRRTDPAHLDAFRGAVALLAPFHPALDDPDTPDWARDKTHYAPGLAAQPFEAEADAAAVAVVFGGGGGCADGEALAEAARRTPNRVWRVLGPMSAVSDPPSNLQPLGWVEDPRAEIARAGVVVGSAGDGVVSAVLAADRPFVCLPQPRPFDEQVSKARALERAGAAVRLDGWPEAQAWPALLAAAGRPVGDARRILAAGDGPREVRVWLADLAGRSNAGGLRP